MKRILLRSLLGILTVCVLCLFFVQCCVSRKLMYPEVAAAVDYETLLVKQKWKGREISIERDGVKLNGWLIDRSSNTLIVFYGGNAMEATEVTPILAQKLKYDLLVMNYRGYGNSTGSPTEKNLVEDAVYILDEVVKQTGHHYDDVVLVGQSLGSGVAVQVAARRDVGKIVLIVPFDSMAAVGNNFIPLIPGGWFMADTYRSDKFARDVKCPVTIISAADDMIIPARHAKKLADAFTASRPDRPESVKYREFPNYGHNDLWNESGFWLFLREEAK